MLSHCSIKSIVHLFTFWLNTQEHEIVNVVLAGNVFNLHCILLSFRGMILSPHTAKTGKLTDSFSECWNFTAYDEIYLLRLGHLTGAATEAGGHAWGQTGVCSKVCHIWPFQQEEACDTRRPQWYLRWPVGGVQKCLLSWVQCLSQVHTLEWSHSRL